MFGVQVPRNYDEAMEFDRMNGNDKWKKATDLELSQIDDYQTFTDAKYQRPGSEYKQIKVHLVYTVKHERWQAQGQACGRRPPNRDTSGFCLL